MNTRLSSSIDWLRFPLIFFVILLHSYTSTNISDSNFFNLVYPFALWLGETGVPGFFIISGFLFFNSKKDYKQKLSSRFHSLLIPYFLWNSIILGIYIILFILGFPLEINGKSIANYTLIDYFRAYWDRGVFDNGNFVPVLCPLWYIRNLLILSLISPLIYYTIKNFKEFFLILIALWWLTTPHNAFISQSLLFFSLGGYFSIFKKDPLIIFIRYKKIFITLFIFFAILDIYSHTIFSSPYALQLHRLSLIFNLPLLFIISDWGIQKAHFKPFIPKGVFFIYCIHYPICTGICKFSSHLLPQCSAIMQTTIYFINVATTISICIVLYFLFNKYFSKAFNLLTNGR